MTPARFIDVHVLQTVPYSNLNRDDLGSPKAVLFGGVNRTRVSSQCWKRATREHMENVLATADGYDRAYRTRRPFDLLAKVLVDVHAWPPAQAAAGARAVFSSYVKASKTTGVDAGSDEAAGSDTSPAKVADQVEGGATSNVLLFLTESQYVDLAEIVVANRDTVLAVAENLANSKVKAPAKDAVKPLRTRLEKIIGEPRGVIALFGRMIADLPRANVDSGVQVAHAFTVHEASAEFDYFTAVDDYLKGAGDSGAGHLGHAEFSAGTFYRYATVDLDSLIHTAGDAGPSLATQFVDSFIRSLPSGKATATAPNTVPDLVVVSVRGDQPLSYATAFEAPVHHNGAGYVTPAVHRIAEHAALIGDVYATTPLWSTHLQTITTDPATIAALNAAFGDTTRLPDLASTLGEHLA